ncbi:IclR family transcriptional regulator [Mycetocola reblochoni]|uniref:Transcriptional regulator, IclR family n=2 Tax=Mycetocola reblochoni TaxID=331618 RepID=A0A1R4IH84_9MICO|nr:IclR family transcriptional regulator [Mycetocola reblochoni]RLP69691.1 IclR family transcriptional regulator [Mycetocola reblochoni]SJN19098.1 Transcriptional regulator, IclR family [Mycetocola reblochoni REB411]
MNTPTREASGLDILDKADAALVALEAEGSLAVSELAAAVGEPVSSTYRLLRALVSAGWVDHAAQRGRYRLGLAFMRIGSLVEDQLDIRAVALPAMRHARDVTGMGVSLWVRRGARAACIERVDGEDVRSRDIRLGDSLPLLGGAGPSVLLAYLPASERDALLTDATGDSVPPVVDEPGRRRSAATAADPVDLDAVRTRGVAVAPSVVTPGFGSAAAPVLNHRGEIEASLAVSGLMAHLDSNESRVIDVVREAAASASAELGWVGESRG